MARTGMMICAPLAIGRLACCSPDGVLNGVLNGITSSVPAWIKDQSGSNEKIGRCALLG